jgi:DNA-binding winged helix-turn-helix (wHTH) protein
MALTTANLETIKGLNHPEDSSMEYQGCLLKFGPFTLDVDERLLLRDSWDLRLPQRSVDVLLALIEKQGHVVGSQELIRIVWGRMAVQPGNLTHHISELRRALGHGFITTVRLCGYKFVAPVSVVMPVRSAIA